MILLPFLSFKLLLAQLLKDFGLLTHVNIRVALLDGVNLLKAIDFLGEQLSVFVVDEQLLGVDMSCLFAEEVQLSLLDPLDFAQGLVAALALGVELVFEHLALAQEARRLHKQLSVFGVKDIDAVLLRLFVRHLGKMLMARLSPDSRRNTESFAVIHSRVVVRVNVILVLVGGIPLLVSERRKLLLELVIQDLFSHSSLAWVWF